MFQHIYLFHRLRVQSKRSETAKSDARTESRIIQTIDLAERDRTCERDRWSSHFRRLPRSSASFRLRFLG